LEFNVLFRHKYAYIRDETSGVESYLHPVKEGKRYINSTLAAFLFSSHPKRERDRKAHLNYYASTYNKERENFIRLSIETKKSYNTKVHKRGRLPP